MAERAALVTGGSSGIGLAIARALAEDRYGVTVSARRPEKLEAAVEGLQADGLDVHSLGANVANEEEIVRMIAAHRKRFGRLDVLVNNAGVGIGQTVGEVVTKHLDMQLGVNLRAAIIATREATPLLREAGAEHGKALIVNTASIAGKQGEAWLSIYSATKFGVVGFTQAMNKELGPEGIKSCALCPGFVDTAMTDFVKEQVAADEMIRPEDIAESVRCLLRLSPSCVIPEMVYVRPGEGL